MNFPFIVKSLGRISLERVALRSVCGCLYYDLANSVDETSDSELLSILHGRYCCEICGQLRKHPPSDQAGGDTP
jgi:hypothetical protein